MECSGRELDKILENTKLFFFLTEEGLGKYLFETE